MTMLVFTINGLGQEKNDEEVVCNKSAYYNDLLVNMGNKVKVTQI